MQPRGKMMQVFLQQFERPFCRVGGGETGDNPGAQDICEQPVHSSSQPEAGEGSSGAGAVWRKRGSDSTETQDTGPLGFCRSGVKSGGGRGLRRAQRASG